MVLKGRVSALRSVIDVTRKICGEKRIIAVFGNEEYIGTEYEYVKEYPEVEWLDDSYTTLRFDGIRVCVYGTRGALDRLTAWQRKHMPWLREIYRKRALKAANALKELFKVCDYTILLSHYAPTYATLEGEPREIWPELGSRLFEEKVLPHIGFGLAVHGHAHRSKKHVAFIPRTAMVVNVALPAVRRITFIKFMPSEGEIAVY